MSATLASSSVAGAAAVDDRIVAKARKIAAGMLEVDEKDVAYSAGQFTVPGTDMAISFSKVARMA